jgi:hypothetical protein
MAVVIGHTNQTDDSTLAGGSWNASYPITNLQNRYLAQKARTSNALTTSSVITIDMGSAQTIGVVALIANNLTNSATVRIRGANNSAMTSPLYDSGAVNVYEHTDYATSFTPAYARYWRIDIADSSNAAGYIEIGRLFLGNRFRPTYNVEYGPAISIESRTEVLEALDGPEYFNELANRRVWTGTWSALTDYESYREMLFMQKNLDVSGEVYFMEDDADLNYQDLRWFYGRMRSLGALEWPYLDRHSCAVEIAELL